MNGASNSGWPGCTRPPTIARVVMLAIDVVLDDLLPPRTSPRPADGPPRRGVPLARRGRVVLGLCVDEQGIGTVGIDVAVAGQCRDDPPAQIGVDLPRPDMFTAAGSLSSRVDSTATWFGASTELHSALSETRVDDRNRARTCRPDPAVRLERRPADFGGPGGIGVGAQRGRACMSSRCATPTSVSGVRRSSPGRRSHRPSSRPRGSSPRPPTRPACGGAGRRYRRSGTARPTARPGPAAAEQ